MSKKTVRRVRWKWLFCMWCACQKKGATCSIKCQKILEREQWLTDRYITAAQMLLLKQFQH